LQAEEAVESRSLRFARVPQKAGPSLALSRSLRMTSALLSWRGGNKKEEKREKEIKGWKRLRKISLIKSRNPTWDDLAERWASPFSQPLL
jgi:hypothetical protein